MFLSNCPWPLTCISAACWPYTCVLCVTSGTVHMADGWAVSLYCTWPWCWGSPGPSLEIRGGSDNRLCYYDVCVTAIRSEGRWQRECLHLVISPPPHGTGFISRSRLDPRHHIMPCATMGSASWGCSSAVLIYNFTYFIFPEHFFFCFFLSFFSFSFLFFYRRTPLWTVVR